MLRCSGGVTVTSTLAPEGPHAAYPPQTPTPPPIKMTTLLFELWDRNHFQDNQHCTSPPLSKTHPPLKRLLHYTDHPPTAASRPGGAASALLSGGTPFPGCLS